MPRIFYDQKSLHRSLTRLAFSFPTNGASSPASVTGRGVKSVVRTATGLSIGVEGPDFHPSDLLFKQTDGQFVCAM